MTTVQRNPGINMSVRFLGGPSRIYVTGSCDTGYVLLGVYTGWKVVHQAAISEMGVWIHTCWEHRRHMEDGQGNGRTELADSDGSRTGSLDPQQRGQGGVAKRQELLVTTACGVIHEHTKERLHFPEWFLTEDWLRCLEIIEKRVRHFLQQATIFYGEAHMDQSQVDVARRSQRTIVTCRHTPGDGFDIKVEGDGQLLGELLTASGGGVNIHYVARSKNVQGFFNKLHVFAIFGFSSAVSLQFTSVRPFMSISTTELAVAIEQHLQQLPPGDKPSLLATHPNCMPNYPMRKRAAELQASVRGPRGDPLCLQRGWFTPGMTLLLPGGQVELARHAGLLCIRHGNVERANHMCRGPFLFNYTLCPPCGNAYRGSKHDHERTPPCRMAKEIGSTWNALAPVPPPASTLLALPPGPG